MMSHLCASQENVKFPGEVGQMPINALGLYRALRGLTVVSKFPEELGQMSTSMCWDWGFKRLKVKAGF